MLDHKFSVGPFILLVYRNECDDLVGGQKPPQRPYLGFAGSQMLPAQSS